MIIITADACIYNLYMHNWTFFFSIFEAVFFWILSSFTWIRFVCSCSPNLFIQFHTVLFRLFSLIYETSEFLLFALLKLEHLFIAFTLCLDAFLLQAYSRCVNIWDIQSKSCTQTSKCITQQSKLQSETPNEMSKTKRFYKCILHRVVNDLKAIKLIIPSIISKI